MRTGCARLRSKRRSPVEPCLRSKRAWGCLDNCWAALTLCGLRKGIAGRCAGWIVAPVSLGAAILLNHTSWGEAERWPSAGQWLWRSKPEQLIWEVTRSGVNDALRGELANREGGENATASWIGDDLSGGSMGSAYYSSRVVCCLYWFASKFVADPRLIYRAKIDQRDGASVRKIVIQSDVMSYKEERA